MEIGSVGVNAYTKSNVQNERTQQTQQARQVEQQAQQQTAQKTEEQRPPVRNAEGQLTGQKVNTQA